MSHELRTPLNAIIGLTEMMATNAARFGTEKALEPLRRVNAAGTHLLSLINEILDLSKIEAGGNPGGSPEATRRAFNKRFLLDLAEDWQQHGREVFKRVRRESPAAYLKVCAMLVPKEVKLEHSTSAIKEMTDEELEQAIQAIRAMLAAQAEKTKIVEATAEPTALPGPTEVRQLQRKRSNRLLEHVDAAIDPRDGGEANLSSLSKNS